MNKNQTKAINRIIVGGSHDRSAHLHAGAVRDGAHRQYRALDHL
jgi:hypothetical protein